MDRSDLIGSVFTNIHLSMIPYEYLLLPLWYQYSFTYQMKETYSMPEEKSKKDKSITNIEFFR